MQGFTNVLKIKNRGSSFCEMVGSRLLVGANSYFLEVVGSKSCGEQQKHNFLIFVFDSSLVAAIKCHKLEMLDEVQQSISMDSLNISF
jgi:hypothetical protein